MLVSGAGTNLQALLDTVHGREAEIVAVAANVEGTPALSRARLQGVPTAVFPRTAYADRSARDEALAAWLVERGARLVVLAGYMELLEEPFLKRFPGAVINVHPSLLPAFPGLRAIEQALAYGVRICGVTVHFVDAGVDSGPVILQRTVELTEERDAEDVHARLRPVEHELLARAVTLYARGALRIDPQNPRRVLIEEGPDAGGAGPSPTGGAPNRSYRKGWIGSRSDGPDRRPGRRDRACRARRGADPARAAVGVRQGRASSSSRGAGRARRRARLHGRHRPRARRRRACRCGRSRTSRAFRRCCDGRVKTLHPRLYAGLLAVRDEDSHLQAAADQGIEQVDLVCVNLYPFEETLARGDACEEEIIENIDIGGPTMIRAAAKNHAFAAVVVDPGDYEGVLAELRETGGRLSLATRERLAGAAFAYTARYDAAIAGWFATRSLRPDARRARSQRTFRRA